MCIFDRVGIWENPLEFNMFSLDFLDRKLNQIVNENTFRTLYRIY